MNKRTYLYILDNIRYTLNGIHTHKIGSSNNPIQRVCELQTSLPEKLQIIRIYEIFDKTAYFVDELLKCTTIHNMDILKQQSINIEHYEPENMGGIEHYVIPNICDIEKFLILMNIKYKLITDYSIFKLAKNKNEISKKVFNYIEQIKETVSLRYYQKDCIEKFMNNLNTLKYFQGIYFIGTGLGKTRIAVSECVYHIKNYPNDNIIWITFRKDIISGQMKEFNCHNIFMINPTEKQICMEHGKVFVILRQQIIKYKLVPNTINGIFYDECHDASKKSDSSVTYKYMKKLKDTQLLKYRVGLSATPLTADEKQNAGVCELYGMYKKINYFYSYSLFDGVIDNYLSIPKIEYIECKTIKDLCKTYKTSKMTSMIIDKIKNIVTDTVYHKGIIWFPSVHMMKYFWELIKIENHKIYYSTATHNDDDDDFQKAENNCVMLACDKFTTGFDGKNMEFGCNLCCNEHGHTILQKIGRFMRMKELQKYALFFQFCISAKIEKRHLYKSITQNCFGTCLKCNMSDDKISINKKDKLLILDIDSYTLNIQNNINNDAQKEIQHGGYINTKCQHTMDLVTFLKKYSTIDNKFIDDFFGMYDITNKFRFSIDLKKIADWLGTYKGKLKETLVNSYVKYIDYSVVKIKKYKGSGGHNKEQILLTPDCFKLLSMRSHTKKSERVREYYLELEKILDKYKDYIIKGLLDKNEALENNQKPKVYPSRGVIYVIQTADGVTLYKIGKSINFKNRIRNYNADKADNIVPILIYETDNVDIVENCLKKNMKEYQYRKYKEVYQINIDILKGILKECDCSSERITLIKKNKPIKQSGGNLFIMLEKLKTT